MPNRPKTYNRPGYREQSAKRREIARLAEVEMAAASDQRGAAFVIRDDKDRVIGTVFAEAEAKKASRKRGWSYETVPNALTEAASDYLARMEARPCNQAYLAARQENAQ